MSSLREPEAPAGAVEQGAGRAGAASVSMLERSVYSLGYAAFLLGLRQERAWEWLDGCERGGRRYPPLVRPLPTGERDVTWGEFVELGYLREHRRKGVSLQNLRPVLASLREELQVLHPLATAVPYVGGRELVMKLQDKHGLPRQIAIIISNDRSLTLAKDTERFVRKVVFDPPDIGDVVRFHPASDASPVVIDPLRRFGDPTVDGVAVERLWELHDAGESVAEIAETYDMAEDRIRIAISYHQHQVAIIITVQKRSS